MHSRLAATRPRVTRRIVVVVGSVVLLMTAGGVYAGSRLAAGPAVRWSMIWSADFNGPAGGAVDPAQWTYQTGYGKYGNGSVETLTSSSDNVYLGGDATLDITALHQGGAWTSGRIMSVPAFTPPAGGELEVTASIRQPGPRNGLGYWPAFWLLGRGGWPAHGEIDILEDVNAMSDYSGAFHCGNLDQHNSDGTLGPCHEYSGLSSHLRPCDGCQTGFHNYSVVVDLRDKADGQIRWYFDGAEFFSVDESQVGAAAWGEALDHGFSIILDVAMGGSYPDQVCRCSAPDTVTASGGTMEVRKLAVYRAG